ncbi:MAG: hypothetical protein IJN20_09130 [Oscillospiraceae bacterium]|nr:hypothetical protein [Oscillospiraceae bacterium]
MSDNNQHQDFDLDDILNEFHDLPQDADPGLSGDLDDLLGSWVGEEPAADTAEESDEIPMDTIRLNELIAQLSDAEASAEAPAAIKETAETDAPEAPAEPEASAAESPAETEAVPVDTLRLNELIAEIVEHTDKADPEVTDEETIRVDTLIHPLSDEEVSEPTDAVSEDETFRMDALLEEIAPEAGEAAPEEPPRILYNPRTRLRELKRKLVAGPEKRYYELSEAGIGKLQAKIILNLILVVLCGLVTTLYALDMLPDNRLRFVIFTQILSMLLSAFLGCGQMLDGIAELFKGRFTINAMLFVTFLACCVDGIFCLSELRIPCCAAFSLEITMALWASYQRHSTEMAQMDTLRKAVRLHALVKNSVYYDGKPGILRRDGEVEDFMDHYNAPSGPEKLQSFYCLVSLLLCIGIAVLAGVFHGVSLAVQVLSTSLLVAIPASFFVALTRPAALLERRLHMVGSVLCGWQGVKQLRGKASFPLLSEDLFPASTTKLNGVKFYGDRDSDEVVACSTSLIQTAGSGLAGIFQNLLESRGGQTCPVTNFRDYGSGGIGGEVNGVSILLGTQDFLQDMGIEIPEGTMVSQAVYAAIDGELAAVYAISYAKMRSSAAGLISLCGNRKITPVLAENDFMLTDGLLRAKFSINTRRIVFPSTEERDALSRIQAEDAAPTLAMATRNDLVAYAYAVSGARALSLASKLGLAVHLVGGIVGMLIMAALAYLGTTELLTPTHVLLYQLVWMVPGLLITEWTRSV